MAIRDRLCDLIENGTENVHLSPELVGNLPKTGKTCQIPEVESDRYVDVAALRELANRLECTAKFVKEDEGVEKLASNLSEAACSLWMIDKETKTDDVHAMFLEASQDILKAISGASVKDSEREAAADLAHEPDPEREAAADFVESRGGLKAIYTMEVNYERMKLFADMLNRVDSLVSGDERPAFGETISLDEAHELFECICRELDKRLMPCDLKWPKWDDGFPLTRDDAPDGVFSVVLGLNGLGFALLDNIPVTGDTNCLLFTGQCAPIERPKPEVLGADGLPIREGETVWDITSPNDATAITVWQHGGPLEVVGYNQERPGYVICKNDQMLLVDCLVDQLTHTPPDTQERINGGKRTAMLDYWGCRGLSCGECPAKIDGLMPKQRYGTYDCIVAQGLDIARREQELRARTAGDTK